MIGDPGEITRSGVADQAGVVLGGVVGAVLDFLDVAIDPFVNFGMSIDEGKAGGIAVAPGRGIEPTLVTKRSHIAEGGEVRVVDAVFVFIEKDENLGRSRETEISHFQRSFEWRTVAGNGAVGVAEVTVHRVAADARPFFAAKKERGTVTGATEDFDRGDVNVGGALLDQVFVDGIGHRTHAAIAPGGDSARIGPGPAVEQFVFIIVRPHDEAGGQLFGIGHAGDGLGFFLGAGESGQEHRGENGDDSDHDEQFDERKSGVIGTKSRCGRSAIHQLGARKRSARGSLSSSRA